MSTVQVADAAPPTPANGTARPDEVSDKTVPNDLFLHNNMVINRTISGGDLRFHDEITGQMSSIGHDGVSFIRGNINYIVQDHQKFKFAEPIGTIGRQVVMVNTNEPIVGQRLTLEISISRGGPSSRVPPRVYNTLPGEPIVLSDNTSTKVDPAPDVSVFTEPLADVLFTSSLESSISSLSLGDDDNAAGQQALLDTYKRAIDSLVYQHEITTVEFGSFVNIPIKLGPLIVTIAFDIKAGTGSVTASIVGISLGTAKFSLTQGARLSIDVWIAKASVRVWVQNSGIWLEAHASVRFGPGVDFGPKEIYHIRV